MTSETPFTPDRTRGIALAALTAFLWGTVPFGGRLALEAFSAPVLSTARLLSAGLFIAAVVARRSGSVRSLMVRPPALVWLAGLLLATNFTCYMWGLGRTSPALTQVIIQTAPLFLVLLSVAFLGERPVAWHWVGTAVATTGFVLVSWDGRSWGEIVGGTAGSGIALIVLAAFAWGGYATCHKRLVRDQDPATTLSWIFLLASGLTLPLATVSEIRDPDAVQWAAIIYLCVNAVAAYGAFVSSLRHIEASLVAIITTGAPVVTLTLAALFNHLGWERMPHEELSAWKLGGAALVVAGVVLAVGAGRRRAPG